MELTGGSGHTMVFQELQLYRTACASYYSLDPGIIGISKVRELCVMMHSEVHNKTSTSLSPVNPATVEFSNGQDQLTK
jgi:hypothetical protein